MDKKNKAAGILPAAMDAAVGPAQDARPAASDLDRMWQVLRGG